MDLKLGDFGLATMAEEEEKMKYVLVTALKYD